MSNVITIDDTDDDPFQICRQDPASVRELEQYARENGYEAFAAACRSVLEEISEGNNE